MSVFNDRDCSGYQMQPPTLKNLSAAKISSSEEPLSDDDLFEMRNSSSTDISFDEFDNLNELDIDNELTLHDLKSVVVNRINYVARNKILNGIRERLDSVTIKNEELMEERNELEDDRHWSAELTKSTKTGLFFSSAQQNVDLKNNKLFAKQVDAAAKRADKQLEDNRIQEILLEKSLMAADLRISCAVMDSAIIERQESTISIAFNTVNLLLAKCNYFWYNGKRATAVGFHSRAVLAERAAQKEYSKMVLDEAAEDAAELTPNAYNDWKNRILTDSSVVCETRAALQGCKGSRAEVIDARLRHNRAVFILKADRMAVEKAWPTGDNAK